MSNSPVHQQQPTSSPSQNHSEPSNNTPSSITTLSPLAKPFHPAPVQHTPTRAPMLQSQGNDINVIHALTRCLQSYVRSHAPAKQSTPSSASLPRSQIQNGNSGRKLGARRVWEDVWIPTSSPSSDDETVVEIASPSPEITGGFDDAELPWLELVVQLKLRKLVDERVTVAGVCSRCRELGFDLHNHVGLGTNFSTVQEILMREALALQGWGKIIEIAAGGARKDGAERYFGMDRWVDWCIEDEGKLPEVAEALMKACGWMRVSVGSYNDLAAEGSRVISIVDRMKVKLAIWRAKEQYNAVPNVDSDGVRRIAVVTEAKAREVED